MLLELVEQISEGAGPREPDRSFHRETLQLLRRMSVVSSRPSNKAAPKPM
jgi:hypothetical protein